MLNDNKALQRVEEAIGKLKNKDFNLYFFVIDCKNTPNDNIQYIYKLAKALKDKSYNVKMVYQLENEYTESELKKLKKKDQPIDENRIFTGVGEWLGKEYMEIEHFNITKDEWKIAPSDFLFIPEAFSSLMKQTYQYKAPCKRIAILYNYNYITEFIPFGDEWGNYGVRDVLCSSVENERLIKEVFGYVNTKVLYPYVDEQFRKPLAAKKLIVNIMCKREEDINRIMKQFYWKYPIYKFITFRNLRGLPKDTFCEYLKEGAITVWCDNDTPFGLSPIEAIRCGNIVVGKVPEHVPEWMDNGDGLINNGIWCYDINSIHDMLSKAIGSWMKDRIPQTILDRMEELNEKYTKKEFDANLDKVINEFVEERISEFYDIRNVIKSKITE